MSDDFDKLVLETTRKIHFDEDFLSEDADGEDVTELALLLTTLSRSASQCGHALECGALQGLVSWEPGRSFHLKRAEHGFDYTTRKGVSGWEDLESAELVESLNHLSRLEFTRPEILRRFKSCSGVIWAGIREFETSKWEISAQSTTIAADAIQTATKLVLQLDVLLKGHNSPRSRMRLDLEQASLWSWSNLQDDYLMVLAGKELGLRERAALIRAGEAFLVL